MTDMNNAPQNADRFDFTKTARDLFALAISLGIVDATEMLVYGLNGLTPAEILDEFMSAAWAGHHDSPDAYRHWVHAVDAMRKAA